MCDLISEVNRLRRPRLLIEAAVRGQSAYQRRRDLRRMLRIAIPVDARAALAKLLPLEAALEKRRVTCDKNYSAARHVDIMIALMAEARSLKAEKPQAATPSSPALRRAT